MLSILDFETFSRTFFFPKTLITTDSSRLIISNSTDYIKDLLDSETQAQKYYRTSINTKVTNKSASKFQKKSKISGVGVIGRLVDGFIAFASNISTPIKIIIITQDDIFNSMIENQMVAKIKEKYI
jgi:hypothetical protein